MVNRSSGQGKGKQTEDSPGNEYQSNCSVKSFYGNKSRSLRWTKPSSKIFAIDVDTNNDFKQDDNEGDINEKVEEIKSPGEQKRPVRRFYKRDDVFWTSNVYGKKRKVETKHDGNLKKKERKINVKDDTSKSPVPERVELISCSIETQTSFSSSQGSSSSSPIALARSSPFIPCDQSIIETSMNESSRIEDPLNESSEIDTYVSDDSEPYEMFNCDTSSQFDSSFNSEDKTPQKGTPTHKNNPQKETPAFKKTPTLLNYFTKIGGVKNDKLTSPSYENDGKKKKDPKQLHFSKKGLASKTTEEESEQGILFDLPTTTTATRTTPKLRKKTMKNKVGTPKEQMYIDVGQKDFGHVKCDTCGMVYTKSQEEDEEHHAKYHQRIVQKLKFKGWKNERVVEEFPDGRIVAIHHSDYFMHLKKLNEIREVVDAELGFASTQKQDLNQDERAYLFISSKKVVGCVIAVPVTKGYPIIPESNTADNEKGNGEATQSWCCSTESVKALCGISRIWVFSKTRRQKIATRLVECIRRDFLYGCIIEKKNLAFSDPTPNGRVFAENYIGKKDVLVFR